jgi:hypothetical protein
MNFSYLVRLSFTILGTFDSDTDTYIVFSNVCSIAQQYENQLRYLQKMKIPGYSVTHAESDSLD